MRQWLWVVLVLATTVALGQEKSKEDIEREARIQEQAAKAGQDTVKEWGWGHRMLVGINLSQTSFTNWAPGGDNALAYTAWLKGNSTMEVEDYTWANTYKLAFGQSRLGNQDLRKTDDEIYLESVLIYKLRTKINPYVSASLRTQFADGFQYDAVGTPTQVSAFFDPAYLTQSAGVAYKISPVISTRLGIGLQETFSSTYGFADDRETVGFEKSRVEGGLESVTDVGWDIAENIRYVSKLSLFSPFKAMDEVNLRWDNVLAAKVHEFISAGIDVQVVNEKRVSPRTQIKEVIFIGFNYTLL